MNRKLLLLGAIFAQALPGVVFAQAASDATPKPTDPAAPAPSIAYRSPFAGYRASAEHTPDDWRALNDEAARIGGHVGIMRGAAAASGAVTAGERTDTGGRDAPGGSAHHH